MKLINKPISKVLFFLMWIFVSQQLTAQKISLEAGYFNPKRIGKVSSETYFDAIRIGGIYEHGLKYNFGIQSGLLYNISYSNKVQKFDTATDSVIYNTWAHAFEIPVRIVYNQGLFKDFKVFGFAGPNFQIGFIQNQNVKSNLNTTMAELAGIQVGRHNLYKNDLNLINFQLGAGGGVQWREFILKGGYDWGMNNLDKTKRDKRLTQGYWYVSFAYQIK